MSRPDARTLLRAWQLCRAAGLDLFAPGARERLAEVPGLSALRLASVEEAGASLVEALRAIELATAQGGDAAREPRLTVTHPGPGRRLPATRDVARALVQTARLELLLVGFSITDEQFSEQLLQRGLAGVAVTVVSDRKQGGARELFARWPRKARPLRALEGVEPTEDRSWVMHGKTIVADRRDALVGSANFTRGGLSSNIEIGCQVTGSVAEQICRFIEQLENEGWLQSVGA